jgi:predicted XRE-type DNA-binding protein
MSRFTQRAKKRLANPDVRAGYEEADAEIQLLDALDHARAFLGVSQQQLAEWLGRSQPAVSQFFNAEAGVTIERFVEYLKALHLQARIAIVQAPPHGPTVVVENRIAASA